MKYTLLPLLFIYFHSLAQYKPFEVKGKNCVYNGKELIVEKILFRDSTYASVCQINDIRPEMPINVVPVKDCNFSFKGEILFPTPFSVVCPDDEPAAESTIFFVDAGTTEISFGNLIESDSVLSTNSANKELEEIVRVLGTHSFQFLEPKHVEENLLLLNSYIKSHPDSYVAMWLMIIMVERAKTTEKYSNPIVLQTCNLFSEKVKNTPIFNYFSEKFEAYTYLNQTDVILPFEKLILGTQIKKVAQTHEFVLIDFWSTGCKPCIQQLPELKNIYEKYNSKGFTIFSISTDPTKEREAMATNFLKKYDCRWQNYFDGKQQDYNTLLIPYLPSNLLIDKTGKIVQKNINLDALSAFLGQKLRR